MEDHYYAVIMAGGGGTRLWPLSRQDRPKQMLSLISERSLFQMAVDRLEGTFPPDRILIVTVKEQAGHLQAQYPEIPEENYLLEPLPRGTASVVGMAAAALQDRDPQAVMAVLTADHIIPQQDLFQQALSGAYEVARDDYLVTLGISPTYPATGYGYIKQGSSLGSYQGLDVYTAEQFTEKPDQDRAEKMLDSGDYVWNSGMFIWTIERILEEFYRQMPALAAQLEIIAESWGSSDQQRIVAEIWPDIKPETIDFGIMEGAERVAVIPVENLGWSDVGSWESLFDVLDADDLGNVVRGSEHISLDSEGTLIYTAAEPRTVVTIGTNDLVIVDTGDVLLVCDKSQSQRVREIVKRLSEEGKTQLL
ncbi:MAG: mannose-1-phosphate guanylyltransferase [Anaerolineales bacterium]|nr:mannose-1-phosphate guanylyltransferase [Anaerolineales bacterium]